MFSEKDIDQIEKYLSHELNATEMAELDQRIDQDKQLAAEFDRRHTAHQALDLRLMDDLRAQLEALEAEEESTTNVVSIQSRRNKRWIMWAAAASVVLLLGVFFIGLPGSDQLSGSQLAEAYYERPDMTNRSAPDGADYPQAINSALESMKTGAYSAAIQNLRTVTEENDYYILAQYLLGHSLYESASYAEAEKAFAIVAVGGDPRYEEEAQWYGVLSCLAQDKECTESVQAIASQNGHAHQKEAQKILK